MKKKTSSFKSSGYMVQGMDYGVI